jgi:hypothetical protein
MAADKPGILDGVIRLTEDQAKAFAAPGDSDAAVAARRAREVVVAYAERKGGLTREVLSRIIGPWFGRPALMLPWAVAKELNVPFSEVDRVWRTAGAELQEDLRAVPELTRFLR